jgi:hypothetical protein
MTASDIPYVAVAATAGMMVGFGGLWLIFEVVAGIDRSPRIGARQGARWVVPLKATAIVVVLVVALLLGGIVTGLLSEDGSGLRLLTARAYLGAQAVGVFAFGVFRRSTAGW